MRDYIRVWTSILYDADPVPTGETRAGFFKMSSGRLITQPQASKDWIDLYKNVGGYTDPQLMLNEPRWYGWDLDALIVELNTAYFTGVNFQAFVDGTQTYYEPKTGQLDIFKTSPYGLGYNSVAAEKLGRASTAPGAIKFNLTGANNLFAAFQMLPGVVADLKRQHRLRDAGIVQYAYEQVLRGKFSITEAFAYIDKNI